MKQNIDISTDGIKKVLKNYNPKLAIAEFIWNGFDAQASIIKFNYKANDFGRIEYIEIIDNGYGINFEQLNQKFRKFYSSEKAIDIEAIESKFISTTHGKNGVGRLTFFVFANNAKWETVFKKDKHFFSGNISINTENLNNYTPSATEKVSTTQTFTKVIFNNLSITSELIESEIIPFLVTEFCWFLELNKEKEYQIFINDELLNYDTIIEESEEFKIVYNESSTAFDCKYIQWKERPRKELSKFYFINNANIEVFKDYTTWNKKGDEFYHSIYVKSAFFEGFDYKTNENRGLNNLFAGSKNSTEYKYLISELNVYLRKKRKPFLHFSAVKLFNRYEEDGIFPTYKSEWERIYKKPLLEETLIGLYEAQPKLFVSLNNDQKKVFVRFLDLLLDSHERDHTLKIVEEIVDLDSEERESLAKLFQTTKLDRIINTIKLIEDRFSTVNMLKELVYNPDLKANEVNHLQSMIESHYWLFGEQYQLVTAAEPKFEEGLRRYIYHLTKDDIHPEMSHPDKLKEMDIFACRQNTYTDKIENVVIELKHPNIKIGRNQVSQVDKYIEVILSDAMFNASNMSWEFYLIGKEFDTSEYIERQIESNANHGIKSLIHWSHKGRVKMYAKTWSEIFADFEIKHKHLNDKLQLERQVLISSYSSANEVVLLAANNSAVQPKEILIENE
ncbi:MAG: ATP-binding protein [Arcicella sp.]|jgi:hypothetical protein|nr:ATP-binding protein [Arcicella sp.]